MAFLVQGQLQSGHLPSRKIRDIQWTLCKDAARHGLWVRGRAASPVDPPLEQEGRGTTMLTSAAGRERNAGTVIPQYFPTGVVFYMFYL